MDVLSSAQRRKNMQAIRSKNTMIEVALAKGLWERGYRYRKNDKTVFGKPDLTFKKLKIAIFCDSEYFHGKDWELKKSKIKTNSDFWQNKIEGNIRRDLFVNKYLTENGWKVIRFWGQNIKKNLDVCIKEIEKTIQERSMAKR
jgi:DNA mismatch endonuclease, patch repair protein